MSKKQKKKQDSSEEMNELLEEIENDPRLQEKPESESKADTQKPVKKEKAAASKKQASADSDSEEEEQVRAKPGKYITFRLAGEDYGIYILNVKEIIGMMNITKVPRTPDFVRGVINLRGKVHPVIDLRKRFGMEEKEDDERTPIIIVEIKNQQSTSYLGIVVDAVSEVLNVGEDDLEQTPSFGVDLDTDFILGLAKSEERVITLLDIDRILTSRQLVMLDQAKSG